MKERVLLKRFLDGDNRGDFFISNELLKEMKDCLAQPEQKPLTREEISYGFRTNDADLDAESYWAGVKLAEKMHGIGVDDE